MSFNTIAVLAPTVPTPSKPSFTGFNTDLQKISEVIFAGATLRKLLATVNKTLPRIVLIRNGVYFILPAMPLAEDIVTSRHRLTSYSDDSVSINESVYRESLVLTADSLLCPWPVKDLSELGADSLAPILESAPAVVLLGTGVKQQFPRAEIFGLFGERGIGLEVMDNGALCRTFNILVAEDRAVTAAIILPG